MKDDKKRYLLTTEIFFKDIEKPSFSRVFYDGNLTKDTIQELETNLIENYQTSNPHLTVVKVQIIGISYY